ncbi:glycosyltransferase [Magnetovirga frankeli]|uniref:glycosyltransferase n=1 Tax=Magnetovirga frankeli TaxID=947516 RepID=UPI001AFBC8FC|nr:glycosyltransferase [gamma proteobacterium SS-5]
MTKTKLLVLSSTYPRWANDPEPGFVHELSKRLTERFEVHVLCPHAPGCMTQETLDGVQVHRFRYAPSGLETLVQGGGILNNLKQQPWKWLLLPPFLLGLLASSWYLTRRLQPAAIHAHWIIPQGLVAALAQRLAHKPVPILLTSHGGDLYSLRHPLLERLKGWALRQASALTLVSSPMIEEAKRLGADAQAIHTISMGVDFRQRFRPNPQVQRKPGQLLFVGRLVEKKGVAYLLQALPEVIRQRPDTRLTLIGSGPEADSLHRLSQELDLTTHVEFLAACPQEQLTLHYQQASLFVAPFVQAENGDREGLGLVTIEAIACGCPVLVGDLPVLDDIFTPAEQALRIDPRDTAAFAASILQQLNQPEQAQQQAEALRQRLMQKFDWERVTQAYARLVDSLRLDNSDRDSDISR